MVIVIKRASRFRTVTSHLDVLRVGEIYVGPAIAVMVDQRDPTTHRFHNVFLLRAGKMFKLNSGRSSNVH